MPAPLNTFLTSGEMLPGVYGFVQYNAQGSTEGANRRCLIVGFQTAGAAQLPNTALLPASQQEADDGWGRGSDMARQYAAALAQPEAQGAEVWGVGVIAPSGGTAGTYVFTVIVPGTNPTKPGSLQFWIASRSIPPVSFDTSDTASTIAANLATNIAATKDLPFASSIAAGAAVTCTYIHKGTTSEDLPQRCQVLPAGTGVSLSPGAATFAVSSVGAGSVRVTTGARTVSAALSGGEANTAVATLVAAAWNADTFPLSASVSGAVVTFLYNNNQDVNRLSAAIVTSTGTTVNLGSGATDGTGSATSLSYNGTQGAGAPDLTTALVNLTAGQAYRSWTSPWTDATTWGLLATNIINNANGSTSGQKQQHLTVAFNLAASVVGGRLTAISPNLTTSDPRFTCLWCPDAAVQGYELSARVAAARAALWFDDPSKNWNRFRLLASDTVPMLLPSFRPTKLAMNAALRTYALAPVAVGPSGNLEIVKGRTTSLATDKRLWAWSAEAQAAYHVVDLAVGLDANFSGGSLLRYSEPKAPGIFDDASFITFIQGYLRKWEGEGNYDGADLLSGAVRAQNNGLNPFREDCRYPESPVLDLDQVVFSGLFTSPSA